MSIDFSPFLFESGTLTFTDGVDFVAKIPPALGTKLLLLNALQRELQLPSYFGRNWDALSDCLRDLSWIKNRRVIIEHADLPPLQSPEIVKYLEVLSDCARDWRPEEDHELVVVFPASVRPAMIALQN